MKSYSSAGQAILLLILVSAYGAIASRVDRTRLVGGMTLFFAAHLGLFMLAVNAGLRVGIVYFLWIGIFNLMVVAQFWALAGGNGPTHERQRDCCRRNLDRHGCGPLQE